MPAFDAVVREVIPEAPDTVTLLLDPGEPVSYRAGQFLSIDPHRVEATSARARALEERKKHRERPRAYSLASAPHEPLVAITVKKDEEGVFPTLLSPHLVHDVRPGDALPFTGFSGLYALPDDLPPDAQIVHLCAGSGIVPNYSILKDVLHRKLPVRQTLLYSNRSWAETIYAQDLAARVMAHPGRLEMVLSLTRDAAVPNGLDVEVSPFRIDEQLVRMRVPELSKAWFFVCGPSVTAHERRAARMKGEAPPVRFLESMKALLLGLGVTKDRLFYEGW